MYDSFDGYCSTVQGLLDWFQVGLGIPELVLFRFICALSISLSIPSVLQCVAAC